MTRRCRRILTLLGSLRCPCEARPRGDAGTSNSEAAGHHPGGFVVLIADAAKHFVGAQLVADPALAAVADAAWLLGAPRGFRIGGQRESINASGYGAASLVQTRHAALTYDYALCMKRPISAMERAGIVKQMATTERRVRAEIDKKLARLRAA